MMPKAMVSRSDQGATSATPHGPNAVIELRKFSVSYPLFTLEPLSLSLNAGEAVALVGPNGSGKTTTLEAIAGQLRADYVGQVCVDGVEVRAAVPEIRTRIGVVPEELLGYRWMTVRQHLDFLRSFYPTWDCTYERALLDRLELSDRVLLGALSKGMRVKLAIVAAEAFRPSFLLLDEPTSGLDPVARREVLDIVRECVPDGSERVVIFSTHLLEDVAALAERVIVLKHGRLCIDASVAEIGNGHPSVAQALYAILEDQ